MSDVETMDNGELLVHWFEPDDAGIRLALRRYVGPAPVRQARGRAVLMLHGGSASFRTFLTPSQGRAALARWLFDRGFDPWLLDWRGSGAVVEDERNLEVLAQSADSFTFNHAAQYDLPGAVRRMRSLGAVGPYTLIGFCMGGGVVAEAIARGFLDESVERVVLMTLGLFYQTPVDGRMKGEARLLERFQRRRTAKGSPAVATVDPRFNPEGRLRADWPEELEALFGFWPDALRAHGDDAHVGDDAALRGVRQMCNRLAFMYGMPYAEQNLVSEIHGTAMSARGEPGVSGLLPELFGAFPLHMWMHGARNIRRGHATGPGDDTDDERNPFVGSAARERFRSLDKVTLIGGALDRLWHRDSLDRMYEWLCHGSSAHFGKFRKRILPDYAHQDLLWGTNAVQDVFPEVLSGVGQP